MNCNRAIATSSAVATTSGANLQTFTGARTSSRLYAPSCTDVILLVQVGGISAPAVTAGGRGFEVENNDSFLNLSAALGRSCDVQVSRSLLYRGIHAYLRFSTTSVPTRQIAEEALLSVLATPKTPNARQLRNNRSVYGMNVISATVRMPTWHRDLCDRHRVCDRSLTNGCCSLEEHLARTGAFV